MEDTMPDLIPATPEVLIVHPLGAIIWENQLDEFRSTRARPVQLPPALPAFVGHSRLLLN
jgi:hypothetical protein